MIGRISSFQSLGTVDGPGVRCVVFMQGCPLRCAVCHNPETWDVNGGNEVSVEELIQKIARFKNYFGLAGDINGGVTVSGGEPLMQAAFVTELFTELKKRGIHTALDTSGCIWNEDVSRLLAVTDLVLLDHKFANARDYYEYTLCRMEDAEKFLGELQSRGIPTWIRRVIIPDVNDDIESEAQLDGLAARYSCIEKIERLPFRKICQSKYEEMGIEWRGKDWREG